MKKKAEKQPDFDGHEVAESLYGERPKKRRKKIEKVKKPDHWRKDFEPQHQITDK